jgi:acyl-coenzyme A synthetase/AMP-(fatty) acid ligase
MPDCGTDHVTLHTSGSTGVPVAHAKKLIHLMRGAAHLRSLLSTSINLHAGERVTVISSVPSQHMFGFETSVMYPLMSDAMLWEGQPLLPHDVSNAFERLGGVSVWVTTPVHLSALVRSGESLGNCSCILSSTMPLPPRLAAQAEALTSSPVIEIYGSTETGMLASRRPAQDTIWRPMDGVVVDSRPTGILVSGSHFDSPQALADRIKLCESGFELLGRGEDVVKIAGRRASLAGLNQLLEGCPGLEDASFFHPQPTDLSERMVLLYVGSIASRNDLLDWLRGRIDPAFLPRVLIRVAKIPRNGNGKLRYDEIASLYQAWANRAAP